MAIALSLLLKALSFLPRQEIAVAVRHGLSLLAASLEGATKNQIEHDGEVIAFEALDNFLANIADAPSPSPALAASSAPATPPIAPSPSPKS